MRVVIRKRTTTAASVEPEGHRTLTCRSDELSVLSRCNSAGTTTSTQKSRLLLCASRQMPKFEQMRKHHIAETETTYCECCIFGAFTLILVVCSAFAHDSAPSRINRKRSVVAGRAP